MEHLKIEIGSLDTMASINQLAAVGTLRSPIRTPGNASSNHSISSVASSAS